jgi:hypothetical protein
MIVLDCGKNTSTMYDSNTDTCLTVPHSVLLELPERLDSGSLVVCEYAHLGTPRTKSSRSQPFTADQLLELYSRFEEHDIELRLFPQQSTPRACTYSGLAKSDENDPKSIYIFLRDHEHLISTLMKPPKSFGNSPFKDEANEYKKLTNALINCARRDDNPYTEDGCSKFIIENFDLFYNNLSEKAKDIFQFQKYKTNGKSWRKGDPQLSKLKMPQVYAVVCTLKDDEGNTRIRPHTGEIAGWHYTKRHIFCMTPNHLKGGVARSNLYYHGIMPYVNRKGKENGFDFQRKVQRAGYEKPVVIRRGDMTPEEDAFFVARRKEYCDAIRELWQLTKKIITGDLDSVIHSKQLEFTYSSKD